MPAADPHYVSFTTFVVCTTLEFAVQGVLLWWLVQRLCRLCVRGFEEQTQRSVSKLGSNVELIGLLGQMRSQSEVGDFQRSVNVDPHSEVGQIAAEYNRVLERVNAAILEREAAQRKYQSIFDNAVEGIFQTTPEGHYIVANPALARIYGYDSVEAMIHGITNVTTQLYVDPARRDDFVKALEQSDTVTDFESQVYQADGKVIWISENARAQRDEQGRVTYYEGTVEDITQRKHNEDLIRQKHEAEAANRAKSAFLANMSHEIRTPLNGVIGMLDLLSGTELTVQQRRFGDIAKSSADALLSLINDVLDFSKIEAGKLELESISFDLWQVVEDVPEIFLHRAAAKGVELTCQLRPDTPHEVRGDPERLRQVLVNLVSNALKFTERGEVSLRVTCEPRPQSNRGSVICFVVSDTGIGIPADRLDRLFNSFSQVDASTTRRYGGTGLGLAICKQLVDAMGGKISVESCVGEGSTFWFELPLEIVSQEGSQPATLPRELASASVLVVDDNATNLEILTDQLGRWGLQVHTESSPASALRAMQEKSQRGEQFDLGILDCVMPEMSGLELAEQIRGDHTLKDMRLMMLSSLDDGVHVHEAERLGLRVLPKPIRQSRLYDALVSMTVKFPPAATPVPLPRAEPAAKGGSRGDVLIADDNEINRMVAGEIVRSAGFRTTLVANGFEVVEAVKKRTYDLVLMDCEMPEMDGFVATREIRRLEAAGQLEGSSAQSSLPIIALTAQAVQGDRQRCLSAGMTEYATKPVDRRKLLDTMDMCLANRPRAKQAATAPRAAAPAVPAPAAKPATADEHVVAHDDVLNVSQLVQRCMGKVDFAHKLLEVFSTSADESADHLALCVSQGRKEELARTAHALKGSALNIAAPRLSTVAAQLESVAKGAALGDVDELVTQVLDEVQACRRQIERVLRNKLDSQDFPQGAVSYADFDRR